MLAKQCKGLVATPVHAVRGMMLLTACCGSEL
jgi:hypothetical protein